MLDRVTTGMELAQDDAAYSIQTQFGNEFVYYNENGNLAISREVLAAFRKLSAKKVVWERGQRIWRLRQPYDGPGRQQDW
jgi:hypothetical protein